MTARFAELLPDVDAVIFSDYAKGCLVGITELLELARQAKIPTLVDPKMAPASQYAGAFLLKPNQREFGILFGEAPDRETILRKGRDAVRDLDLNYLIVTLGPDGMLLIGQHGLELHMPTEAQEVFDVSGAGDTVIATLALSLARGFIIQDAVAEANIAASIAVSHAGTYVVTEADLTHRRQQGPSQKIASNAMLVERLAPERRRGKSIVFTNGCFDILHPGHVRMLQAARRLGDVLVVAINEDASVKRLKGPTRPVNTFADRAEVLAALSAVDFVTGFSEDTPYRLLQELEPDVLVKGGDYSRENIAGADIVEARGGRVVALDFHDGYSTTRTLAVAAGER